MKHNSIKYFFLFVTVFTACVMFCGCDSWKQEEGPYRIYYKNQSSTGIGYYSYEAKADTVQGLVEELWKETCSQPDNAAMGCAIPSDVVLLKYTIDGSNLSVYFNTVVQNMETSEQLLFRAAVVKTFTRIDGIDSVTFFVDEKPLTGKDYMPLGAQTSADYVDIIANGLSSTRKATLVLYYADETGEKLKKSTRDIVYESSYSLERDVLNRLIQGPSEEGYYSTLPSTLQVISINVKSGICYVNFDSSFLSDALSISGYTIIYSIVNSLCELADVKKVQIMVDGESNVVFKENISLASPLERNLNF